MYRAQSCVMRVQRVQLLTATAPVSETGANGGGQVLCEV